MGNTQHQYSVLQPSPPDTWKLVERSDHSVILENHQTGQLGEVYTISIRDKNAMKQELEMYEYRKTNPTNLVSVFSVQKAEAGFCSGSETYKVITEFVPLRLSQIDSLDLPQALYILKECLQGFELIYGSIEGPITISKEMIGINSEGRVKVWINHNFAINHPDSVSYIRGAQYQFDNSVMPLQLAQLVEEQIMGAKFPAEFKARIDQEQQSTLDFARMKAIVRNFCIQNNIILPESYKVVREELVEVVEGSVPRDKILIIQETTIQRQPPPEVLRSANVTTVTNVPSIPSGITVTSLQEQPGLPVQQGISNRSYPSVIQYEEQVTSNPTRMPIRQPQRQESLSRQPSPSRTGYPIQQLRTPPQSFPTPTQIATLPPRNLPFSSDIPGYDKISRPLLLQPQPQPQSQPQPKSMEPMHYPPLISSNNIISRPYTFTENSSLLPKYDQYNYKLPSSVELKNPYGRSTPVDVVTFPSPNTSFDYQRFGIKPYHYEPLREYPSRPSSMLKNDAYMTPGALSRQNSLSSFKVNNSPSKNLPTDLASLKSYDFSTSAKNNKNDQPDQPSPLNMDRESFDYIRKPLFQDLKDTMDLRPKPKNSFKSMASYTSNNKSEILNNDDLFRRIDELSNNIKSEIDDVKKELTPDQRQRNSMKV